MACLVEKVVCTLSTVLNCFVALLVSQCSQMWVTVTSQSVGDESSYSQVQLSESFQRLIGPLSTSFEGFVVFLNIAMVVVGEKNVSPVGLSILIVDDTRENACVGLCPQESQVLLQLQEHEGWVVHGWDTF
jgi:hypothetical protein